MTDGIEPHDHIYLAGSARGGCMDDVGGSGRGRGVPGVVGGRVGTGGAIPGTQPDQSQDLIFSIFKA